MSEQRTIDLRVGDVVRLKPEFSGNGAQVCTITEMTERGFKYKHPRRMIDPYSWSEGGETYRPDMYERATYADTAGTYAESGALSSNQRAATPRDFSVWSFLRAVLEQGAAIHLDYRDRPYEEHSARLDEAARERAKQLMEALRPAVETTGGQL